MLVVHASQVIADADAAPLRDASILIRGDRIEKVGSRSEVEKLAGRHGATVVDATGLEIGTLGEGKRADLVALEGDPLTDVMALWKVKHLVLRGKHLDLEDAARRAVV